MALVKRKHGNIPEDAVLLSESQALTHQMNILNNWKNAWDVFGFRYSGICLSIAGGLTGIFIHNHYRIKLKLFEFGKLSTYIPVCILPSVLTYFMHVEIIIPDLILKKTECPICVEMRASAIQATLGCILPAVLAPISSLSMAVKYATFDVPYLHKEPLKVFQLYTKMTKPIGNILFAIFVGHALLASAVTYAEANSIYRVNKELAQSEYDLEHGLKPKELF
ncbi:hypothetical protein HHI36_016280 [Cryptolaemus montrouzieri]|uniref:Uncharacterized protein n=1 Tax=Cryptolaemus montrouzieri TaxID=559131 RepID=A0ABD2NJ84_9CUCU